jgi:hypothetical protein
MTRVRRDARPGGSRVRRARGAAVTDARITAVRDLLRDVCAAADGRDLAPRWGVTDGPASTGARFVIACPPDRPFEEIGVVPWPDETYGVVDVRLRDGPWEWPPIEVAFGPFHEDIQIPGAPSQLVATWDDAALPATARLSAWVRGVGLASLSIRRDPRAD